MNRMNRRELIKAGLAGGSALVSKNVYAAAKGRCKYPNVLWIMMDDGRADAVGCYGKSWAATPNMDQLARRGVRFAKAVVQNPVCVPSRKSMQSGYYAHRCGPIAMGKPAISPGRYTKKTRGDLPNLLTYWKKVGIQPVNVGKIHAYKRDWLNKGDRPALVDFLGRPRGPQAEKYFDAADFEYKPVNIKTHRWMIGGVVPYRPEDTQTWRLGDLGVQTLKDLIAAERPFFLRVSFHAPHVPCRVPKEFFIDPARISLPVPSEAELNSKPRFEREQLRIYAGGLDLTEEQIGTCRGTYYGMVSLVDAQVGRLVRVLRRAGLLDSTIIAINSDQGFQLGEHGLWKKRVLYDQNVCVPFILSCPGLLPAGRVVTEPVEMIDFIPTLMELAGLSVPEQIDGRSLLPLIHGTCKNWRGATFCEIDHSASMYEELRGRSGRRVMVRTKDWKLIYFMDERVDDKDGALYNLKDDPEEQVNLYGQPQYAAVVSRLEELAEKWDQGRLSRPPRSL